MNIRTTYYTNQGLFNILFDQFQRLGQNFVERIKDSTICFRDFLTFWPHCGFAKWQVPLCNSQALPIVLPGRFRGQKRPQQPHCIAQGCLSRGGPCPLPLFLKDQLTLSQPGGQIMPITTCPHKISDLPTALRQKGDRICHIITYLIQLICRDQRR